MLDPIPSSSCWLQVKNSVGSQLLALRLYFTSRYYFLLIDMTFCFSFANNISLLKIFHMHTRYFDLTALSISLHCPFLSGPTDASPSCPACLEIFRKFTCKFPHCIQDLKSHRRIGFRSTCVCCDERVNPRRKLNEGLCTKPSELRSIWK